MAKIQTLAQKQARWLNAYHAKHCWGFYGSGIGGRYFKARAVGDMLEVSPDFGKTWIAVPADAKFHSPYGTDLPLPRWL